jgi:Domain of unknown function (DUF2382)
LELVLHDEEIVVQRRVVPRERVRVDIDVVHEQVDVSDVIRHQRIQVQKLPPSVKEKERHPGLCPVGGMGACSSVGRAWLAFAGVWGLRPSRKVRPEGEPHR